MARKSKYGNCRICSKKAKLDPHHIISQHRAKKINQEQLIRNPGNIVFICRKCHNQTTASLVRRKMAFKRDEKHQEEDVMYLTIESLEAQLAKLRAENKQRMKEVRELAEDEIADKDSTIDSLEQENDDLKRQLELLDDLSLEYQIARGTKKMLKKARKDLARISREIETEIKKEVKEAFKSVRKVGSDIRKKTGL